MSAEQIYRAELENQRETLQLQYRQRLRILQLKRAGAQIVYANQTEAAFAIIEAFMEGKMWVVLVAPPGAGKTGVILEVLRLLGEHVNEKLQVHIKNMLVITGMSDTDWSKTMKDGMLEALHGTVYHRGELNKKVNLAALRDGIIVTDECHVACRENQTIDKKLREAGLKSIPALQTRNMRMLDVSATPEGVLYDLRKWREHTGVVVLRPDEKYKGFQSMKDENRLLSSKDYDLDDLDCARNLIKILDDRYKNSETKKYFAFRISSSTARGNVSTACMEFGWDTPQNHDSTDRVEDIDNMMENAPSRHKVFFVKGFWRASKRLVRKYVGGTYESPTMKSDDTSKSQGLTARFCSTFDWEGEQENVNFRPLHFDDLDSINRYLEWWAKDCDYNEAAYKAPRLYSDGEGVVRHPPSKANPTNVVGACVAEEDPVPAHEPATTPVRQRAAPTKPRIDRRNYKRAHKEFPSAEEAMNYYVRKFGNDNGYASRPHKSREGPNAGKYECSFSNMKAGVYSIEDVRKHLSSGNLWGAHIEKLDDDTHARIGTLKIGYTGDVPTFVLCVYSKTDVQLND